MKNTVEIEEKKEIITNDQPNSSKKEIIENKEITILQENKDNGDDGDDESKEKELSKKEESESSKK